MQNSHSTRRGTPVEERQEGFRQTQMTEGVIPSSFSGAAADSWREHRLHMYTVAASRAAGLKAAKAAEVG
jgi:hypothetical protein